MLGDTWHQHQESQGPAVPSLTPTCLAHTAAKIQPMHPPCCFITQSQHEDLCFRFILDHFFIKERVEKKKKCFPQRPYRWYSSVYPGLTSCMEVISACSPSDKQMSKGCGIWRWPAACCCMVLRESLWFHIWAKLLHLCDLLKSVNFLRNTQAAKYLGLLSYCGPLSIIYLSQTHGWRETELSKVWTACQLFT